MKHISTIVHRTASLVNTILAVVLILILLTIGLPNFNVQAAGREDPISTATIEPLSQLKSHRIPVIRVEAYKSAGRPW